MLLVLIGAAVLLFCVGIACHIEGRDDAAVLAFAVLLLLVGWLVAVAVTGHQCEQMGMFERAGKVYICSERK